MMPLKSGTDGNSGSPARGEPENMIDGVTRCPHGERRELLLDLQTKFLECFNTDKIVYVNGDFIPLAIATQRITSMDMNVTHNGVCNGKQVNEL